MARTLSDVSELPDDALVSNAEAAALAGVSMQTCWRWDQKGVPGWPAPIRLGPKTTRRRLGDVREFIAKGIGGRIARPPSANAEAREREREARAREREARAEVDRARAVLKEAEARAARVKSERRSGGEVTA